MQHLFALDTETHLITERELAPKLVCVSEYAEKQSPKLSLPDDFNIDCLEDGDLGFVFHNAAFDLTVLGKHYGVKGMKAIFKALKEGRIYDTMLFEKLIYLREEGTLDFKKKKGESGEFSLAEVTKRYLDLDISEEKNDPNSWRMRYSELDGVPLNEWPQEAKRYAMRDAEVTLDVFLAQMEKFGPPPTDMYYQIYADFLCRVASSTGVLIDLDYTNSKYEEVNKIVQEQYDILIEQGLMIETKKGKRKKETKVIQKVVSQLYKDLEVDVPKTPTGRVKCDDESLQVVYGSHLGIDALVDLGQHEKEISTYLGKFIKLGMAFPQYEILKTTGRMSCSRPNMQNLPRKGGIRQCFVPREGYYFCSIDYGQLELCSLAQVIKEIFKEADIQHNMLEAINSGQDLHCLTGSTLIGEDYDSFYARYCSGDSDAKEIRQLSKIANFGFPGGLGYRTFVPFAKGYGVQITEEKAEAIRDAFFETFPEVQTYLNWIANSRQGEHYRIEQIGTDRIRMVGKNGFCQAANSYFQGLAADGFKRGLIRCYEECFWESKSATYGSWPLIFVHDETIFEVQRDRADSAAVRFSELMVQGMKEVLPDVTLIKAQPALMERWYKEAEPVYDSNNRLILWRPE